MSARGELARDIFLADNWRMPKPAAIEDWDALAQSTQRGDTYAHNIATRLLAAGYSKPRTISTVEELDALPVGSVILHNGRAFQHYPAYPAPFDEYQQWKCGDGGFVRSTKDGSSILPAMLIHGPEES